VWGRDGRRPVPPKKLTSGSGLGQWVGPIDLGVQSPLLLGETATQVKRTEVVRACGIKHDGGFGINIVEHGDEDCLGRAGQLGRPVLGNAVVREDDVLQDGEQPLRQPDPLSEHQLLSLVVEHQGTFDDVADQFAPVGVVEGLVVDQFAGLAQVVQEQAEDHDIAVDLGIERADGIAELDQIERVFEQAAEVGVVHALGGGRTPEGIHQMLIFQVCLCECLGRRVFECVEQLLQLGEHDLGVTLGAGQQFAELFGAWVDRVDRVDDELQFALIGLRLALDIHKAFGRDAPEGRLIDGPHASSALAGLVTQEAAQVWVALLGASELRVGDAEGSLKALGGLHVADRASGRVGGAHGQSVPALEFRFPPEASDERTPLVGNLTVCGTDYAADPASAAPVGDDLQPGGVHGRREIIADPVGDGLVVNALISEALQVDFEAFQLDTLAGLVPCFRLKSDGDGTEVGVPGYGADTGELFGDVFNHERQIAGRGEGFE
jgi:hypothetical protein